MKKLLFIFSLCGFTYGIRAQLTVNLQLPPMALTVKNQLWSMALINSSGGNLLLRVDMNFTDIATSAVVMTATTGEFQLAPGTRQMQTADFMPLSYTIANLGYGIDNNPNGFLPIGHFNVCYEFTKILGDNVEVIAEECESIEIDPLNPPVLVFPEDESMVEFGRPVFNWIPPVPANLFNNLSYDLRLVQVANTQTADDAIQQNIALYAVQNINLQSIPYPGAYAALDTGKLYAWQVSAKNNNVLIAKSDVWTFRISPSELGGTASIANEAFAKLRADGQASYFLCTGMLKFQYDNYLSDDSVELAIYDLHDYMKPLRLDSLSKLSLQPGQVLKSIDITAIEGIVSDRIYQLELVNSRKEKWTANFLYKKDN